MNYSHLEDYVKNLYTSIGINNPEQLNKNSIAVRLGITLYAFNGTSEGVYSNGRQYIFLNRNLTRRGQWQEFGHELCHILRHAGNQKKMPRTFIDYQEWQAENFALHFCIPTFMLMHLELPKDFYLAARMVRETFHVTYEFAEKRLDMWKRKEVFSTRYAMPIR
ncbi:ImmA/IrrE family metallo-endopeptidase [Sporosarcina sp. NPDC096371]|uniref:ImmA/IrrE family metallo-endopeptidase n=1 Tax=Sporosarcina sp. NPDC096371 TaxID=3364530 RepID=UPI0037FC1182